MATGTVTTSRGNALNIDQLIQQAQRPVGTVDAASTRQSPNYSTPKSEKPRVRGFVPSSGEAEMPAAAEAESPTSDEVKKAEAKVSKGGKKSLAEHTKVTVKKTAATKKAEAEAAAEEVAEEDETLGDILDDMDE